MRIRSNLLAAIAGATQVLARGSHEDATTRRFLAIIQRQNRHLRQIVDDLLEVSRMLSGKIVQERDRQASAEAAFDVHLVKPIEPEVLMRAIEEQFMRSRAGLHRVDLTSAGRAA